MPFDDENIPTPTKKVGLKISNADEAPSAIGIQSRAEFEKIADAQFSKIEEYKQQIWDLSIKYKSFVESRVLPENRGPIASNLEKEVLDKLVELATAMNEDASQEEGIGSTALCMLLMKCMLIQRDVISKLSFKIDTMEKHLATAK